MTHQGLLTLAEGNLDKVKLLYLFQLSFVGTPCIYYGDEIGMAGGPDPECRACMIWDESKQDRKLFNYVKQLIELRKTEPVFSNGGKFRFIHADNEENYIIYEKYNDEKSIFFVLNNSNEEILIPIIEELVEKSIYEYKLGDNLESLTKIDIYAVDSEIKINPYSFRIFEVKNN